MCVAVIQYMSVDNAELNIIDWGAYIGSVPGQNHKEEYMNVALKGSKQPKELAVLLFPGLPKHKYRD